MVITWFGLASFKISSGNLTLVTDPFDKSVGLTPPRVGTDIAIISDAANPAYNNQSSLGGDDTFIIDGPGEYDIKGLFVRGIAGKNGSTIYSIRLEGIRLGFLGSLQQRELSDGQLEALGEIEALLVPVGGHTVCDAEQAIKIVNQVEPQIAIPMHYAQKGLLMKLDSVEVFLKETGAKPKAQDKLTIKKSDFTGSEETQIVILTPQR